MGGGGGSPYGGLPGGFSPTLGGALRPTYPSGYGPSYNGFNGQQIRPPYGGSPGFGGSPSFLGAGSGLGNTGGFDSGILAPQGGIGSGMFNGQAPGLGFGGGGPQFSAGQGSQAFTGNSQGGFSPSQNGFGLQGNPKEHRWTDF